MPPEIAARGAVAPSRVRDPHSPHLVERTSALEQLERWLADACAGHGRLVLVEGEAGVGKTSLLQEFVDANLHRSTTSAFRLLWAGCDPLSTPRPLAPLADIAPSLGGEVEALLEGGAQRPDAREVPRGTLFGSVLNRLTGGGRTSVLVIEDLHWADDATLDLLKFLARRTARVPVLILGSYRDEELAPAHPLRLTLGDLASVAAVRRLPLRPLSFEAVSVMAAQSGLDARHLFEITGGNPFYVTEVIAAEESEIPATVRDAVLARASRLSGPARHVLDAASVVTPPVETWLLTEVAGSAPEDLDECVAAGMLRERPGGVEFRHELMRRAIERTVPPGRRGVLHRRTLTALLARPGATHDSTRLAHHAEGAGDVEAVLAHALPAGQWAAALGAHHTAADQYGRALRFAAGLAAADLADLLERHSYECYLTSRFDEATASRERALACWRAVGDRLRQGDGLRWLSRLAWFHGDFAGAERCGHAAVTLLRELPPGPELAMAYSNLAQLRMLAGDTATTRHWGQQATELAERLGRMDILAHALNNIGTVDFYGDPASGHAKLGRSLALARKENLEEHVARAYNNLAAALVAMHRFGEAERWIAEGLAYCAERDLASWRSSLLVSRSRAKLAQGQWPAAQAAAAEIVRDPRAAPVMRGEALIVIGRVRARRGEAGVWLALEEVLGLPNANGLPPDRMSLAVAFAEAAWLGGEPARARPIVEQALAVLPPDGDGAGGWLAAELAYWCRRLDLPGPPPQAAPPPFALQEAGDWSAAAEQWRALGCPYEAAWALADSGRESDLRAALTELQSLGARPGAAVVSRRLREIGARGVTRGPRATTKANPANLTERECEVLALVAEGLRNGEIADRLYVSAKTVDHHVSAILAKLGVRTRGEAARAAARLGLLPNHI